MARSSPRGEVAARIARTDVLRHRARAQQLDRQDAGADWVTSTAVLDLGVQDTGGDGAAWALALRGARLTATTATPGLALAWTLRGAPHAYRRTDLPHLLRALAPASEADARRRVFDASKPLVAAGTDVTDALVTVARAMREVVAGPTVKGELSGRLTGLLPEPYLRWCRPCGATHVFEQTFRIASLHAGLELEPGTSPPVLRRAPELPDDLVEAHLTDFRALVATPLVDRSVPAALDPVRGVLALLGPARASDVAGFLDVPPADVRRHVAPLLAAGDVVEVDVVSPADDVERRWALADALEPPAGGGGRRGAPPVRLLGPFDLFLQGRDRELLVPDADRRRELWPALGRPGAVLADGEVVGTWRPRAKGRRLAVLLDPWVPWDAGLEEAVDAEIARLAAFRGLEPAGRASA